MVYKKLEPKEAGIIGKILVEKRMSLEETGGLLSISPRTIRRYLSSKSGIKPLIAQRLYEVLGGDQRINFLISYGANPDNKISEVDRAWERVVDAYVVRIKKIIKEKPEERTKIIGELERISNNYIGNPESQQV